MTSPEESGKLTRRQVLLSGAAAGAALAIPSAAEAQQVDNRIQKLEGYNSKNPQLLICLTLHNKKIQAKALQYITLFQIKKVKSQEQMNSDRDLNRIETEIETAINDSTFKRDFIQEMRKTLRGGEKFVFETHNNPLESISLRLEFYYLENGTPALLFDTNGVFPTGG